MKNKIWFCRRNQDTVPKSDTWLLPGERLFAQSLKTEKRRRDWVLGRWTAKQCLLQFFKSLGHEMKAEEIGVFRGETGAPEVKISGLDMEASISLSHRADEAIAVCGPIDFRIGCDLEIIEERSNPFIEDYFLDSEQDWIHRDGPDGIPMRANLLWSAKESVMKSTRKGLSLHPRKICVRDIEQLQRNQWSAFHARKIKTGESWNGYYKLTDSRIMTITWVEDVHASIIEL